MCAAQRGRCQERECTHFMQLLLNHFVFYQFCIGLLATASSVWMELGKRSLSRAVIYLWEPKFVCLCVRHSASFWLMKLNQLPGLLFPTFSSYCVAQKGSSHITSVSLICFLTAGGLTYQLDWTEPFPSKGPGKASGLELPNELANSST